MTIIERLFWPIERLFLWSSGADMDALDGVPTEKAKYYGIGGTIVFTALMATFAGGYAFFTAFQTVGPSIFFGIFWGALIFNLDRYIVSSFGVGDGKRSISRQEVIEASPRILMAALLGFVIATPLELKLFHDEIDAQVEVIKTKKLGEINEDYTILDKEATKGLNIQLSQIDSLRSARKNDIAKKQTEWFAADNDHREEVTKGKYSGHPGDGSIAAGLKRKEMVLHAEYNSLVAKDSLEDKQNRPTEDSLRQQVIATKAKLIDPKAALVTKTDGRNGLLVRLEAMGEIIQRSPSMFWAKWLITLLFIFVEIAPVLFKMMTERGPYDDIVDQKKYEVLLAQQLRRSKLNEDANAILKVNRSNQEEFLKAEMDKNRLMLQQIVEAQNEIATEAIAAWKEEQKVKMRQNVGQFIKTSTNGGTT